MNNREHQRVLYLKDNLVIEVLDTWKQTVNR